MNNVSILILPPQDSRNPIAYRKNFVKCLCPTSIDRPPPLIHGRNVLIENKLMLNDGSGGGDVPAVPCDYGCQQVKQAASIL